MTGNTLNEFMDDMYHNPEKEISYYGKRYMKQVMLMKHVSSTHWKFTPLKQNVKNYSSSLPSLDLDVLRLLNKQKSLTESRFAR